MICRNFPYHEKDLRDHYPYGLFAADMKDIVRIHASSGTSGKPTTVAYTKNDMIIGQILLRER